jgi:GTP-sensing pleiotropic transcriptional regulator CodY
MEIFFDGHVYGICWKIYNNDKYDYIVEKYEKRYNKKMDNSNIQEITEKYDQLTNLDKINSKFYFLTNSSTTYDTTGSTYVWYNVKKLRLEKFFLNKYDDDIC